MKQEHTKAKSAVRSRYSWTPATFHLSEEGIRENGEFILSDAEERWGDDILNQLQRRAIKPDWIRNMVLEQMSTETKWQRHAALMHALSLSYHKQFPDASVTAFTAQQDGIRRLAWRCLLP